MSLFLKPDVHAVAIGADLALLDLARDAYLCLPDAAAALTPEPRFAVLPGPVRETLEQGALLTLDPPCGRRAPPPLPERTIIHSSGRNRPGLRAIAAALAVPRDIRNARKGDGLHAWLAVADAAAPLSPDPEAVAAAARLFWRLGAWLPVEGECLVRSAMLVAFLRRMGLTADWVFGVRLWPFAAHCWVQSGDLCLNDDVERLWPYTPLYCR